MSLFFLTAAGVDITLFLVLSVLIYRNFKSGDETKFLNYYRKGIASLLSRENKKKNEAAGAGNFLHFLSLHLFIPFTGFAFFLRTDANFLVFILSILWSIQLFQRLYPGVSSE